LLSFAVVNVKDVGECQIVPCIGRGFAPFPSKEALGKFSRKQKAEDDDDDNGDLEKQHFRHILLFYYRKGKSAVQAWGVGRGERGDDGGGGGGELARREKHAKRGRLAQDEACLLVERGQTTNEAEGTSLSLFL
ncbi:hypothetical protein ALC56_13990, partial [Trachymyrmex septentrionalis]